MDKVERKKELQRRYWKTKRGKMMLTYNNMNRRVRGIQKKKMHLYEGLSLLSRDLFYKWTENSLAFEVLFNDWVDSGYSKKLSPSIDRIDSSKGYEIGNIRWITQSENSRLGAVSRWSNKNK